MSCIKFCKTSLRKLVISWVLHRNYAILALKVHNLDYVGGRLRNTSDGQSRWQKDNRINPSSKTIIKF